MNIMFQLKIKYKTTWMHPGSKEWLFIDYILTKKRDIWCIVWCGMQDGSQAFVCYSELSNLIYRQYSEIYIFSKSFVLMEIRICLEMICGNLGFVKKHHNWFDDNKRNYLGEAKGSQHVAKG